MLGKPIEKVTADDVRQLIEDGVAESRTLEFKVDIPVHQQEQKSQRTANPDAVPIDRGWIGKRGLMPFGRDSLAEEVVAFANAGGGTIVLGMDETGAHPPRAGRINPLPELAALERRLRDAMTEVIEPRLPYFAVRAIPTEEDGSGVVLIETTPSTVGPHWVKTSRKPTIRREDSCSPMSMPEVHEMVLRQSRYRDHSARQMEEERTAFKERFRHFLRTRKPDNYLVTKVDEGVAAWLNHTKQAALGAQVTLTPHVEIGIPRLESLSGLTPVRDAIGITVGDDRRSTNWIDIYDFAFSAAQKILGGMVAEQSGNFTKRVKVMRDGRVTVSFLEVREIERCICHADLIATAAGFAMGVYDRLRSRSSYPAAPADVTVDVLTWGHVGVGGYDGHGWPASYGQLMAHEAFPIYTLGSGDEIALILRELVGDLMNAGNASANMLPPLDWRDPH